MTVNQCIEQLLEVEERRKEGGSDLSLPYPHCSISPALQSSYPTCALCPPLSVHAHYQCVWCSACGSINAEVRTLFTHSPAWHCGGWSGRWRLISCCCTVMRRAAAVAVSVCALVE